jgi:phytoene synthase
MMAVLMGVRDPARLAAAVDLGVAMQLSNIARDVGEDARNGRIYLPLEWLVEAGIDPDDFLADPRYSPALGRVVGRLLDVADEYYRDAGAGITRLPLNCRFGIGAARLLYAEIGREVERRGLDSVSGRAVVPGWRKITVLAAGLAGLAIPLRRLTGTCVPEGVFLVDAVVRTTPRPVFVASPVRWWSMVQRVMWTIDLFERMERRERVQP